MALPATAKTTPKLLLQFSDFTLLLTVKSAHYTL